jgi:hypothetical protein
MDLVGSLFKLPNSGTKTPPPRTPKPSDNKEEPTDEKSSAFFKTQKLERTNFDISILSKAKWWPDEMVAFLDILKLGYIDFISKFEMTEEFDQPIKNSIYYMVHGPYSRYEEIARFVQHNEHSIPNRYVSAMVAEDNCRMYDLEVRPRSSHEQKHYLLFNALAELMKHTPISYGKFVMDAKDESAIKRYMAVFNLRKYYAAADDVLRTVIQSIVTVSDVLLDVHLILEELLVDFEETMIPQLRHTGDKLFNKILIFYDLLSYAVMRMKQCDIVFNGTSLQDTTSPSPRLLYVYNYFKELTNSQSKKVEESSIGNIFGDMTKSVSKLNEELKMMTPRYFLSDEDSSHRSGSKDGSSDIFVVGNHPQTVGTPSTPRHAFVVTLATPHTPRMKRKHRRKSTADTILFGKHSSPNPIETENAS